MEPLARRPLLPETLRGRLTLWLMLSTAVLVLGYCGSLLLPEELPAPDAGSAFKVLFTTLPLLYGRGGLQSGRPRADGPRGQQAD
ncbi:hypothetical protein [Zhihengliuella sp.]|uniref:hypothetical protein n=1 Tax=Zhihengliuella sp. TaxID=1954483 RepID=UPI00281129FA|nr:hypothetical protein [Zhihengliuella sp.]